MGTEDDSPYRTRLTGGLTLKLWLIWRRYASQKSRKKCFVLDTNVLLHNADSMFSFEENDVVLPIQVIEELDRFKNNLMKLDVMRDK